MPLTLEAWRNILQEAKDEGPVKAVPVDAVSAGHFRLLLYAFSDLQFLLDELTKQKPHWACTCGAVAMPLTDRTTCSCTDYYEQDWRYVEPKTADYWKGAYKQLKQAGDCLAEKLAETERQLFDAKANLATAESEQERGKLLHAQALIALHDLVQEWPGSTDTSSYNLARGLVAGVSDIQNAFGLNANQTQSNAIERKDPPCWHRRIGSDGICLDCGGKAAVVLGDAPAPEQGIARGASDDPSPDEAAFRAKYGHSTICGMVRRYRGRLMVNPHRKCTCYAAMRSTECQ